MARATCDVSKKKTVGNCSSRFERKQTSQPIRTQLCFDTTESRCFFQGRNPDLHPPLLPVAPPRNEPRKLKHVVRYRWKRACFRTDLEKEFDSRSFTEYLKRVYENADFSTPAGKAVRLLCDYEEEKYFYLVVCFEQVEFFKNLCFSNQDVVEITDFYCSIGRALHVVAFIPDSQEFVAKIWNLLPTARESRVLRITDLGDFYDRVVRVSTVANGRFACTSLSFADRLRLALVVPEIALRFVGTFCRKPEHLNHYDVRRTENDEYVSELNDVLSQIGCFDLTIDSIFPDKREKLTAKECLEMHLGKVTLVWKNSARKHYQEKCFND